MVRTPKSGSLEPVLAWMPLAMKVVKEPSRVALLPRTE